MLFVVLYCVVLIMQRQLADSYELESAVKVGQQVGKVLGRDN